ncbi:MAG TPA: hypothetical protein VI306_21770 [Pyrinomonadaceae bacterium]
MKSLLLVLCLAGSVGVVSAQQLREVKSSTSTDRDSEAQLQLSTAIDGQRYAVESGRKLLYLTLELTYTNTGTRPILLDRQSSLVYRKILSKSLKAAAEKKYKYDESLSFIDVRSMKVAGMQRDGGPDREAFTTLGSGQSYRLKKEVSLQLSDGTKDTNDLLHPGNYVLELKVATWFYLADPVVYREKWQDAGYLWTQNITSIPMSLRVEKR